MPDYSDKMGDFSIIEQEGEKFSLLLYDDEAGQTADDEWEKLEATFGKLHWELPPDISRYVQYCDQDQRKILLMPHVVVLRQIQMLLLASMDCIRQGNPLRDFGLETMAELSKMLFDFHQETGKKQEKLAPEKTEDQ